MAEFVGGEPVSVGVDEPITFENKTDTAFDVSCGVVFRKSGLYRVSVAGKHTSVEIEPERKKGKWKTAYLDHEAFGVRPKVTYCSECNQCIAYPTNFCPNCGARMMEGEE